MILFTESQIMKIRILDADPAFLLKVEKSLSVFDIEVVGISKNFILEQQEIRKYLPDVILCNVHLGDLSGTELLEPIEDIGIPIVFMSDENDLEAYKSTEKIKKSRFIVKPIHQLTLKSILDNLYQESKLFSSSKILRKNKLYIKEGGIYTKISLLDIDYIFSQGNYSTIHVNSRKFMLKYSLNKFVETVDCEFIIRIHRSYAVNIDKIDSISMNEKLVIIADQKLPIGRTYIKNIRKILANRI